MRLVFLGAPGSGKGTQARILMKKYGVSHLSTGDMLRSAIAAETAIGLKTKSLLDSGRLVGDDIVNRIVSERLDNKDCASGFILDGYPRTLGQAKALQNILVAKKTKLDLILELKVDGNLLFERLQRRIKKAIVRGDTLRSDDNSEILKKRLIEYNEKTLPLLRYYAGLGELKTVDGMADIDVVSAAINVLVEGIVCCKQ